jgi:hypothetical protein
VRILCAVEQSNGVVDRRWTEMPVALRRRENAMAGEFLNGACRRALDRVVSRISTMVLRRLDG